MRLGFAVAAHIDADVLLLDEVFAVGDEEFQRKCFGKIFEYKQRGGTIVFVSHDAASVERLCRRAVLLRNGRVELDGSAQEAIARYHKLLADERDPAEGTAGLREYGSGEARIAEARLLGPDGEERQQLAAGEPLVVELRDRRQRGGRRLRGSRSSSGTRPASCSPPPRRTPTSSAGRRPLASACCGSTSSGRRSPTAGSGCGSSSATGAAAVSTTGSTTRSGSSSIRARTRAARCSSTAPGRCRRSAPLPKYTGR